MIVKNCPAYYEHIGCMSEKTNFTDCERKNDCIIKQIISKHSDVAELLGAEDVTDVTRNSR